jgi:hypothetical protein
MQLKPFQRKVLLRYKGFLDRRPTPLRIFASVLPHLVLLLTLLLFSAYALPATIACFFGGLFAGALVYQVSFSLKVTQAVATLLEFLDWNKVDRALASSDE